MSDELVPVVMSFGFPSLGREFDGLKIDRVHQKDGPDRWAVRWGRVCINHQGEGEYEPLPSSRTDEFLARCRFETFEEALTIAETWVRRQRDEVHD